MILFLKLIFSATNLYNESQFEMPCQIKKLIINGTTYFYYPVTMYNGCFKVGTFYKNYCGANNDMCITNGIDYDFYVEASEKSMNMGFFYAVPETLISTNIYVNCYHNIDANQRILQVDPLMDLYCDPNIVCKMNFCQQCRKYYF
ncbi:hypothetical protein H311_03103, partial [Anncaliia algerae PRA109]